MPLSEDEERILSQIEQELYATDPGLARQVGRPVEGSHQRRDVVLAVAGLVAGLVLTVALLGVNPLAAWIFGFGLMCVAAVRLESALRFRMRESLRSAASAVRSYGVRGAEADERSDDDL